MRCHKCAERNSVAARKCEFCGERFKRKPLPLGLKLGVAGVATAAGLSLLASWVVPKLMDPEQTLARAAKRVAAGPKSADDAKQITKDFSDAVKAFLKQSGPSKPAELTASLQKALDSTAYEVHVSDLPRGLKLIEIDTLLQATDFIVMNTNSGVKVFDLPRFEVFDDARILNDSAGPVLALLGHSGGPPPHRPIVKTYALLPDYISDESEKLIPAFWGEGTAKFDKNSQDIKLELSLQSLAKADNVAFDTRTHDNTVHDGLHWKDAHYVLDSDIPTTSAGIAYQVSTSLRHPERIRTENFSPAIAQFINANTQSSGQLVMANMGAGKKGALTYRIANAANQQFVLSIEKRGNRYCASDIRLAGPNDLVHIAAATPPTGSAATPPTGSAATSPAGAVAAKPAATDTSGASVNNSSKSTVAVTAQPQAATAGEQGTPKDRSPDKKIVVRGLTEAGTKLAANMPSAIVSGPAAGAAQAAVPAITTAPKAAISSLAATAQSVSQKLSGKHSKDKQHHDSDDNATASAVAGPSHDATPESSGSSGPAHISGGYGATLRITANKGAKSISDLTTGDIVQIIGKKGDWYHVRSHGHEGYVFASLVTPDPALASSAGSSKHKHSRHKHGGHADVEVPIVAEATALKHSGHDRKHKHSHEAESQAHKLAMVMPEPAAGKHSRNDDKDKRSGSGKSTGGSHSSSHNKAKVAAVEPLLVP